ncbi:MAG: hypothetical protein AAF236_03885, partial [Verrucomicrobiota bacterium]
SEDALGRSQHHKDCEEKIALQERLSGLVETISALTAELEGSVKTRVKLSSERLQEWRTELLDARTRLAELKISLGHDYLTAPA